MAYSAPLKPVAGKYCMGFLEGLDSKILVIERRSYGLRDEEYLSLKILTCCSGRYKLTCLVTQRHIL